MLPIDRTLRPWALAIVVALGSLGGAASIAADPVRIRVEPLTVPPATQPLISVVVRNLQEAPCTGTLSISGPADWRIAPDSQPLELAAGAERHLAFNIEKARNVEANVYPFTIQARVGDRLVRCEQSVFVASAPYSKATVDGRPDEWQDAIPVSFEQQGQRTTISTFWSRKRFYVLVAVQEQQQVGYTGAAGPPADAVQLAIASPEPPDAAGAKTARRFEFVLTAAGGVARCFQLAGWDTPRERAGETQSLEPLACGDAETAVVRDVGVTYYECSLPFSLLREAVEPAEGREFFLAMLVHDPDGTGIRDLGRAAGLWTQPDDAQAWSRWRGMAAEKVPPLGNQVRWGLCTSKY
jgi:hypothetical protein